MFLVTRCTTLLLRELVAAMFLFCVFETAFLLWCELSLLQGLSKKSGFVWLVQLKTGFDFCIVQCNALTGFGTLA